MQLWEAAGISLTEAEKNVLRAIDAAAADALDMPLSKERAALVSITYNRGAGNVCRHMWPFYAAVQSGNRAEAWYQIRYETNKNKDLASRCYCESDQFNPMSQPWGLQTRSARLRAKS